MRKILILALFAVLIWGAYTIVVTGVSFNNFTINNYEKLEEKSSQLNIAIKSLESQSTSQYQAKKTALSSAVKNYQNKKEQYEELLPEMQAAMESTSFSAVDLYDIDFLWTIIGNYATEEGVTLQFDVSRSLSALNSYSQTSSSEEYVICDLNFIVSGTYITITDFLYDLEDDDRLNFEISNFRLEKGGEALLATFTVKSVPINNKNLSVLNSATQSSTSTDNANSSNLTNTITNSTTNTTNTTNTVNNTTNTTGNTITR